MKQQATQDIGVLVIEHPLLTMNEIVELRTHFSTKATSKGRRWNAYSKEKAKLEQVIAACAFRDHFHYVGPCWTLCFTTKRRVDPDGLLSGALKLILDALQRCNKLPTDTIEHVKEIRSVFRKGKSERIVVLSSAEPLAQDVVDRWHAEAA